MRPNPRRAFTLIELLTVIAITAVLMTIIVLPVYQSFNLTRSAQAFADAQSRARIVADKISREIGNAVSVRNTNTLVSTTLNGNTAQVAGNSLIIVVPKMGATTNPTAGNIEVVLPYVKLDLIPPAEGNQSGIGVFKNPINGYTDPTMLSPKGQPNLPTGPGATMVRYFVGLHNPQLPYNNPYDGILMAQTGGRDNLFVLYRAEVTPFIYRPGVGSNGDTSSKYRPNPAFFQSDLLTDTQIVDEDDPRFFLEDGAANIGNGDPKPQRITNWMAQATRESDLSRYDMIQPIYNKATHVVTYSGDAPQIVPLIQFRPGHITNDQAQGQVALRPGEETNNGATIGPDVFKTQYGLWSNQVARVWPQGWNPAQAANDQYFVGRNDPGNGTTGFPPGYSVYYYDPALSPIDTIDKGSTEVFDIYTYELVAASQGFYPFSQALVAAQNRSNWMTNQTILNRFVAFDLNSGKGKVITSFDVSEIGNPNIAVDPNNPQNLPTVLTTLAVGGPYAAGQGPTMGGVFSDPVYAQVDDLFNKLWQDYPDQQATLDRFIDLRMATPHYNTPAMDNTPSPLSPIPGLSTNPVTGLPGGGLPKSRIVPGSETVYGPDQLSGPNAGQIVRYVRVTRAPGPNQYEINYVDQPEPFNPTTGLIDYTMIGLTPAEIGNFNPNVYDPTNFVSAVVQPRYKKGYIRLNSDPNSPLPVGQIQVDYRFQFNGTLPNPGGVNAAPPATWSPSTTTPAN